MNLVTGGTGLVGSHIILHLIENGESVRAIYRHPATIGKTKQLFAIHQKENLFENIDWIQADITDIPSLSTVFNKIDFVYHCAGLISWDPQEEEKIRKTNIEGTSNIVNFALAHNVKKLCFVSSIVALGDLKENETIINEESEWNPEILHSDYAISKYGAEMEVWRGQQEGLDCIIINPGVILGPRIWTEGSGLIFEKIEKGFRFISNGSTGVVAVTDVARIAAELMESDIKNERFTLIGENIVYKEFFHLIADALKVKRPSIVLNPLVAAISWRIDWLFCKLFRTKRQLSRFSVEAFFEKSLYSNKKIIRFLNPTFTPITDYIILIL